jgi:hypothetical protein
MPFIAPVLLATAWAYATTLAPGITWANNGSDSGDLVTAAATAGIAHPTGYPTYLLLAKLFQALPWGNLALRTTLLSTTSALFTVLLVYILVQTLLPPQSWRTRIAASIAAIAAGFSPLFWSQAIIAEVYSLNALFVAFVLICTHHTMQQPPPTPFCWNHRVQALIAGLAFGNHITIAIPVLAWLVARVYATAPAHRLRRTVQQAGWIAAGLLVYLYLPLRAAAHPPVNWGGADTWQGVWWVVSAQPYRELAFSLPPSFLGGRISAWASLLLQQAGVVGVIVGFAGLVYGGRHNRPFVWLTAGVAAAYSLFAITYNTADSYAYLVPVSLIFAAWIGLGVSVVLNLVARWNSRLVIVVAAGMLLALVLRAPATARQVDASSDRRAIAYATRVLETAPADAIVLTSSDRDTFGVWYYHYALGERPDIAVLVEPLLDFGWYRHNLRSVYPDIEIPPQRGEGWGESIAAANPSSRPLCRTVLEEERVIVCP